MAGCLLFLRLRPRFVIEARYHRDLASEVASHFIQSRMMTIPDGTSEIQKLIIGRNLIGLAAF